MTLRSITVIYGRNSRTLSLSQRIARGWCVPERRCLELTCKWTTLADAESQKSAN